MTRIGNFEGFRAVEIARIGYRTNMNRIFSCAVVASRYEKLSKVIDTINTSLGVKASDIVTKFRKEKDRYDRLRTTMNCALNTE